MNILKGILLTVNKEKAENYEGCQNPKKRKNPPPFLSK